MEMKKILISAATVMVAMGCTWGGRTTPEPEETVKAFYESLYSGEFDRAESLCNTLGMKEYIGNVRDRWNEADSSVMAIVPAILSEISLKVTDIVKNGKDRTVFYELTATDGTSRKKVATLSNEAGAWKIKAITDRH